MSELMGQKLKVFDQTWGIQARGRKRANCWVDEVIASIETDGSVYLETLRMWFDRFPLSSNKQKRALKARLESFTREDHLGAVNELAWWEFMRRVGIKAAPIPASKTPRPDFKVQTPAEFYCEVSTLNLSDKEKAKFQEEEGVELDHGETLRRILLKSSSEKQRQLSFAGGQKRPCALVIFDYTIWSGLGTQFYRVLGHFLLGQSAGFMSLPTELSALGYVERHVRDGRIALNRNRSAIYYNPNAKYPLPLGSIAALNQFAWQMVEVESKITDPWIWL